MADSSTGSPHTNYLVSRWAPERGLVSADGFQWLEERLQEAHNSLVKPNKARLGSRNRSSGLNGFGNMANRGATLGFASVTNGLENPKREIRKTKEEVLAKAEEFGDKAEELGEEAKEFAKDHRVPVPQMKLPFIGPVQSLVVKQLLCGIVAGGVAGTLITPLEIIKTRVMGGQGGRTVGQVVNKVTQVEGVQSVMQGSFSISIIKTALEKGIQFATFEAVKRTEKKKNVKDPKVLPLPRAIPLATLAGAAAGFTSTFFVYPFMVLNDRIVLNSDAYKGFADAFFKILKNEGLQELMRGITPALIKMVPNAAASFYTYETLKDQYLQEKGKKELDNWGSLTIGAAAAAVGTTLTYPLEVARREISLSALPKEAVNVGRNLQYSNVFQALKGIVKNEGILGLYRGLPIEYVEIVPMTAITFAVYEAAKRAFIAINEERRDEVKGGPDE
ncbi:hypothetical protein KC19_2G194400 [Ceratodon purpureus]|uniref:Mitochondrial carrier protein n=1 Tax=Ceratodon purpureus TaxID=3225 RepID=A0A8T0IYM3_CERPU|nr:hypothetical protein KC19_2G194400 [Ceratodon purpureus]